MQAKAFLAILIHAMLATSPLLSDDRVAETRARHYLACAVPDWPSRNRCYSCHNNGDAARVLYQALADGDAVPPAAFEGTDDWLSHPERWENQERKEAFHDTKLARLQFTLALAAGFQSGRIADRAVVQEAVETIAAEQSAEGFWPLVSDDDPGAPTTYGRALSTALITELLQTTDAPRYTSRIERARNWFEARPIVSVLDASAALLALGSQPGIAATNKRQEALAVLRRGRSDDGGWGQFPNDPPTIFDTSLALLALDRMKASDEAVSWISGGRRFLLIFQNEDGSWPETTRPSGGVSYAQRVSTTAWAFRALTVTRPKYKPIRPEKKTR